MSIVHARSLLALALGLGLLSDLLLRPTPPGAGVSLWVLAVAAAAVVLRDRRADLPATPSGAAAGRYPAAPLVLAAAFGLGFLWRDSPTLQALFGAAAFLACAASFLDRPARAGVAPHAIAPGAAIACAWLATPLLLSRARGNRGGVRRGLLVAIAGALLAAVPLVVFGTLFAAADPLFARYAADLAHGLDEAAEHGAWIFVSAWVVGGLLAGLALARFPADLELRPPREAAGDALLVAQALVLALFAAFLAVQARALAGGHAFVEAQVGLSYAEYARAGFFQLLACAAIALPLILVADWAVGARHPRRRWMAGSAIALVAALLAVLASAARRMALYVDAYGLTEQRVYALAVMAWLALAFLAFGLAAVRGSRERFAVHALAAGGALVAALGVLDPAATIVRYNAGVADRSLAGFDVVYASSLGADAVPALLEALPSLPDESRCEVARALRSRPRAAEGPDWRSFNLARSRARALLAAASDELQETSRVCGSRARSGRPGMHPVDDELVAG
jgi:hypothetical protein